MLLVLATFFEYQKKQANHRKDNAGKQGQKKSQHSAVHFIYRNLASLNQHILKAEVFRISQRSKKSAREAENAGNNAE